MQQAEMFLVGAEAEMLASRWRLRSDTQCEVTVLFERRLSARTDAPNCNPTANEADRYRNHKKIFVSDLPMKSKA
jgi:hypothetical protein